MSPGIGHNSGREDAPGFAFRRLAWTRARRDLLPVLPVEVVRLRVKRAAALGLPYRTYAGLRASTGHDLIGFLFSTNALGLLRRGEALAGDRAAHLAALAADRVALVQPPLLAAEVAALAEIDAAHDAPRLTDSWAATRDRLKAVARARGHAADRFVVVGETMLEADWCAAMGAAGYLTGRDVFAPR